jgi:hypothetical protein
MSRQNSPYISHPSFVQLPAIASDLTISMSASPILPTHWMRRHVLLNRLRLRPHDLERLDHVASFEMAPFASAIYAALF